VEAITFIKLHVQLHKIPVTNIFYTSTCRIIAVFNNMRTLKFKLQLTVYVFCCRQSSKRTSWETEAHFSRVIGRYRSILFVSVFQGSLEVAIIMIDGSEKSNRRLGFELQSSHVIENRNKVSILFHVTSNYCCLGSVTEKTPWSWTLGLTFETPADTCEKCKSEPPGWMVSVWTLSK